MGFLKKKTNYVPYNPQELAVKKKIYVNQQKQQLTKEYGTRHKLQRKQFVGSPLMQAFPSQNVGDAIFSPFENQVRHYQHTRHKPKKTTRGNYYLEPSDFDMIDY